MNKFSLSLLLVAMTSALTLAANDDCACGPLTRKYNLTVLGGVAPAIVSDRGYSWVNTYTGVNVTGLVKLADKNPKFGQVFKNPGLNISAQLGWSVCCDVEMFAEFNYRRYSDRSSHPVAITLPTSNNTTTIAATVDPNLNALQDLGGFVGSRYYFNRMCCERLAFFFGGKVGVVNHRKQNAKPYTVVLATSPATTLTQDVLEYYVSRTTVAGGLQVGFDWAVGQCDNFSIFFNAEVLAECGLKPYAVTALNSSFAGQGYFDLVRCGGGTIVAFPVNLGLRFWFGC